MLHVEGDVTLEVTYDLQHPVVVRWVNREPFYVLTKRQRLLVGVEGPTFEDYFTDWRSPTEKEKQMFAMLTGIELSWSESNPFR